MEHDQLGAFSKTAVKFSQTGNFMQEGQNTLSLFLPRDLNLEDFTYFAWYAVLYERRLNVVKQHIGFFVARHRGRP